MITGNKIQAFEDRIAGKKAPITADIFLTEYCNNRCGYCRCAHDSGRYMSFDMFVKVAERLQELGVRGMILTGGGEPTINPDFDAITEWLERMGIDYGINTNFNVYRECNPAFLKVSVDAGTREGYKAVRGVDKLEVVTENIGRFVDFKKRMGNTTRVGVQCVAMEIEAVRDFYKWARGLDVDYIQFRPLETRGEHVDYGRIREFIREARKMDARVYESYKFDLIEWRPKACYAHWAAICVNVDGGVVYCCHRPKDVIGGIFDADIVEKCINFKPDMSECEVPCRLSGANKELSDRLNAAEDRERYFV